MKTFSIFSFCLAFFLFATTTFAQGIYMEIPPQEANGTPTGVTQEILLTSMQYGLDNVINIGSATSGAGAGKTTFKDFIITKQVDPSSIALQRTLARGAHYDEVKIKFYRAGASGARELAYQILLKTVFISSYAASGADGCSNGCPGLSESITFQYGAIAVTDFSRTTGNSTFTWDRIRNREQLEN